MQKIIFSIWQLVNIIIRKNNVKRIIVATWHQLKIIILKNNAKNYCIYMIPAEKHYYKK